MRSRSTAAKVAVVLALLAGAPASAKPSCPKRDGASAWIYVAVVAGLGKSECSPTSLTSPNVHYEAPIDSDKQLATGDGPCFVVPTPPSPMEMRIYCSAFGFQRNVRTVTTADLNSRAFQSPGTPLACQIFPKPLKLVTADCRPRPLTDFSDDERYQYIRLYVSEAQAGGTSAKAACDALVAAQSRPGVVARDVLRAFTSPDCDSKCIGSAKFNKIANGELRSWIDKRMNAIREEDRRDAIAAALQDSPKPHARIAIEILNSQQAPPLPNTNDKKAWDHYLSAVKQGPFVTAGSASDLSKAVNEIRMENASLPVAP